MEIPRVKIIEFTRFTDWSLHAALRFRNVVYSSEVLRFPRAIGCSLPILIENNIIYGVLGALQKYANKKKSASVDNDNWVLCFVRLQLDSGLEQLSLLQSDKEVDNLFHIAWGLEWWFRQLQKISNHILSER